MTTSVGIINATHPVKISNWGLSDNTVMRATFTVGINIASFHLNSLSTNKAVKSQITETITYFGFKAS